MVDVGTEMKTGFGMDGLKRWIHVYIYEAVGCICLNVTADLKFQLRQYLDLIL
jgi:hypothetical protein